MEGIIEIRMGIKVKKNKENLRKEEIGTINVELGRVKSDRSICKQGFRRKIGSTERMD